MCVCCACWWFLKKYFKVILFWWFMPHRLQHSEQQRKHSDQSDEDMREELEGKVEALQKQLTDLDTQRLKRFFNRTDELHMGSKTK